MLPRTLFVVACIEYVDQVYHKLIDTSSSFVVPVDSKGDADWNAEFNVVGNRLKIWLTFFS